MQVAQIILEQLGGNGFARMTGAKNFLSDGNALSMRLPGGGGFTKDGINHVRVELAADDTYTVTFNCVRGAKVRQVSKVEGIYNDMLRATFTEATGLYTSFRG